MRNRTRGIGIALLAAGVLVVAAGLALASGGEGEAAVQGNCNTYLAQAANAGANSIVVNDPTDCNPDDWIVINQGGMTEECQQISDPSGATLYLHSTLADAHAQGETVIEVQECPTPTPEATETPTPEATETPTPEATETPTPEATETPTPEATETPTPEVTETPTPEATTTPTVIATPTPAVTVTPTETATPAVTAAPATATPAAPPATGLGADSDGGSAAVYGLLALGGLLALTGAALVWRSRTA